MITKQQEQAEQAIHEALDANNADTVHNFADFAAGEIKTILVIELLAAIHTMPLTEWETMLGKMHGSMQKCMRDLARALERQRAKFMEAQACANIAAGEAQREDQHHCAHDFNCRGECF